MSGDAKQIEARTSDGLMRIAIYRVVKERAGGARPLRTLNPGYEQMFR
jgi:hypothetical protein